MPHFCTADDFERRIDRSGENGCWIWTGARFKSGYGLFEINCKRWRAHRFSYQHYVGNIGGLHVLHRCDNPPCVNPDHLFLGSPKDNAIDRTEKSRSNFQKMVGELNVNSKLNSDAVREIRSSGRGSADLAREFGVSRVTVNLVKKGKIWRHV